MRLRLPNSDPTPAWRFGSLVLLLLVALSFGAGPARADGSAGSLELTFADSSGAVLSGACYELWTEVNGSYGL